MPISKPLCRFAAFSLLLGSAVLAATPSAQAQAITGAQKAAEITAFGGYTYSETDYGPTKDNGFTLGASYIFYPGYWPVAPAVEVRYTSVSGSTDNEHALLVGLEARSRRVFVHGRLTPYADILLGKGTIVFAHDPFPGYHQDTATSYGLGGGIDYYVAHDVSLKVDYQYSHWGFDNNFILTPYAITIGASYKIPFRSRVGSKYSRADQVPVERPAPAPKAGPPAPKSQPAPQDAAPQADQPQVTAAPAADSPAASATPTASADQTAPAQTAPAPLPADTTTATPPAQVPAP